MNDDKRISVTNGKTYSYGEMKEMILEARAKAKEEVLKEEIKFLKNNLYYLIHNKTGKRIAITNVQNRIKSLSNQENPK